MRIWCFLLAALCVLSSAEARHKYKKNNIRRDNSDSDSGSHEEIVAKVESKKKCGYESCPSPVPGKLNVHLVAHTHDDVGWLKTVDQYYYGSRSMIQKAGVQYILDSVIVELLKDPTKRFIYVETAYLWKWWKHQHDTIRHQVKKLINEGRLEIIGGAWSMNDEAVTHYQSVIDQFTWGLRKINDTFGECGRPRVGWQIDPFGHSREMASMFAQMGYDGLFIGRLDYQDKLKRLQTNTTEMLWRGSANLGKSAELFTGVLYNNYGPPPGFCFDILCDDEPIIDDKESPEYNVNERVAEFVVYAKQQAKFYKSDNIIMTMGEDFNFQDARMWFDNLDKLILHTNALQKNGSNINVFYSTPSCYLKSLHEADKSWPVKSDDFFPYASDPNAYWTGYFTSRPTLKYFERVGNQALQICKQLFSMVDLGPVNGRELDKLREAMGVMQHHDAITGTEKQHVAQDYARILSEGIAEGEDVARTALKNLMSSEKKKSSERNSLELESCLSLNISQCAATERQDNFVVTLYNPLAHFVEQYVRIPVTGVANFAIRCPKGTEISSQLVPIAEPVLNIPGRSSNATWELVFRATHVPPMGYKSFYVTRTKVANNIQNNSAGGSNNQGKVPTFQVTPYADLEGPTYKGADLIVIGNENISVTIVQSTGLLVKTNWNGFDLPLAQDFLFYRSAVGNNKAFRNRSSGAYIFRPNGTEYRITNKAQFKIVTGPIVDEIHQVFNEWVSQVVRVYKDENHIELDWLVGPIPVNDTFGGKEVISRFNTNITNNGTFYTDSNGREMLKRIRNNRATWEVHVAEPVAGNYYPVTAKIQIKDNQGSGISVLNDRAQGGSSVYDGSVELMVHRRLMNDDAFGVDEALNESAFGVGLVARGQHYLIGGIQPDVSTPTRAAQERLLSQRKLLPAWALFSDASKITYEQWKDQFRNEFSGLNMALPKNVHILTLEPWKSSGLLLRLEHILEENEDPTLSQPATVDIQDLFSSFTVQSVRETTLAGNQWLSKAKRFDWKSGRNLEEYVTATVEKPLRDKESTTHPPPAETIPEPCTINDKNDSNDVADTRHESLHEGRRSKDKTHKIASNRGALDGFKLTLTPMQIRTFIIEVTK